jgi:hypothetical protein
MTEFDFLPFREMYPMLMGSAVVLEVMGRWWVEMDALAG